MRSAWLSSVALAVVSACVASESGNSSPHCDAFGGCDDGLVCYRGFCVEDGSQTVSPITGEDASTPRDAPESGRAPSDASALGGGEGDASARDAAPSTAMQAPASTVADAAVTQPVVADAAVVMDPPVVDAGVTKDAAVRDASTSKPDAGSCVSACKPPNQTSSPCKKCVQSTTGQDPEALCGKTGGDAKEQALAAAAATDPFCISLCLGGASTAPDCTAPLKCSGPKCGDMQ